VLVQRWIDVHAHFSPPLPAESHDAVVATMRAANWCVEEAPTWDETQTLSYMDRTGIQMQMLSNIPKWFDGLRTSNDFGADLVRRHPSRFGLLAAVPTDAPDAALSEILRAADELHADGYAVTCNYNGVLLTDPSLDAVWAELDARSAVVFAHPDAYTLGSMGRPAALIDVAFETTRTFVDMLYAGVFRRYPNITFIVAHCGAALPTLSGRLALLGLEGWVPNPNHVTRGELDVWLRRLYLDTAATCPSALAAAQAMTTPDKLLYGSDCGVACTSEATMDRNLQALLDYPGLTTEQKSAVGTNAFTLFPTAAARSKITDG
jgi:predicted TIM-barrel fold metal-dependent hydrolase